MIRNWCSSFIMCSYETVFWLPLFCLVLWRWGWPVNDWNVFLLPLVYLWDCILQHGGSGKKRTSSSWSMQPLRPLSSTDPETILFDQRLDRQIFPPVNLGQSHLRLFKFLASLGLQTSNLGQGGTASSVVQKESPCTIFLQQPCRTCRANRCVALIPCECKPKGNNCITRILWSLAQLYTLMYVLQTAFCYCDQWLRPRTVCQCTDALLYSSVYRHRIDAVQDSMSGWWMRTLKQNSGSHEHLSQYHVLMWMHYCRLCILNLCGCCMCYTHCYCHTQIHKWTNTSPLPYSPPCTNLVSDTAITVGLFAHSQEHGTLTHPWNELGIRKSWGGLAAIQTNYVILLWRWGHHRSRQNSS